MATYADLKQRIIAEMNRDDLTGELAPIFAQHIADAIDEYADMRFWFNQSIVSATTTAGSSSLALPASIDTIDRIEGPGGDLNPIDLAEFQGSITDTGYPSGYTYVDGAIRFSPTPREAWPLTIYGTKRIAAPLFDTDSNAWTNEAQGLISASTRLTLYRDVFRDPEGSQMAAGAVQKQLAKLQRKSSRRIQPRLVARLVGNDRQPLRTTWLDRL
jgi:hypothetical protein